METSNAFEPVARARYTQVAVAMDWLSQFGAARLSGSGGCVFVAVESSARAESILRACPPGFRAYRASAVTMSPLHKALDVYRGTVS